MSLYRVVVEKIPKSWNPLHHCWDMEVNRDDWGIEVNKGHGGRLGRESQCATTFFDYFCLLIIVKLLFPFSAKNKKLKINMN